jgi:hypothetical protein
MKRRYLFFIIFTLICHIDAFAHENLLYELREKIICKNIFDYLITTEYQNGYKFIYEIYGENRLFSLNDAFKIKSKPANEELCNGIIFIESYTYYGMDIEIYKILSIEKGYYLAKIDITKQEIGYELLLFNENEIFLDNYSITSNLRVEPNNIFEYIELYNDIYAIKTVTKTYRALYLTFIVIKDNKFKVVFKNEAWY